MKVTTVFLAIVVTCVIGCSPKVVEPSGPDDSTKIGDKGVLYGSVILNSHVSTFRSLYWDVRQSGVKVEIVGSTITTETDGYGEFKLTDLDSGIYSLHFSKAGYESVLLDSVFTNGHDSVVVNIIVEDALGRVLTKASVGLPELTPAVKVEDAQSIAFEVIKDNSFWHNGRYEVDIDTTYRWSASFSVDLRSDVKATQDSLHAAFYAVISGSSTMDTSLIPTDFRTSTSKGWYSYSGPSKATQPPYISTRSFVLGRPSNPESSDYEMELGQYSKLMNYTVSKSEQLYLHIIPVTREFTYYMYSNRFITMRNLKKDFMLGEMKTIPIVWQ